MRRKLFFFFTLLFILFSAGAYAQIVDEIEHDTQNGEVMSLFEIERLIRKTDYTEALNQLNIYIEKRPEYFDNAQRLIKQIMNRRKQYSSLAERAIKSSTENPEDHETPAKIILQMRSIEKNPPAEIKRMIDMLEELHLFQYYAFLFDSIQEQSAEMTKKGNYSDAVTKVQTEGFDIYRDEFYDLLEEEHPEVVQNFEQILERLNQSTEAFKDAALNKDFDNITAQFLKAVNDDNIVQANLIFEDLKQIYSRYSEVRNGVFNSGVDIKNLYEIQKELYPEITDASYLPFMQRFVLGVSSVEDSGILGAIDNKWNKNVESMKSAVEKVFNRYAENYYSKLPEDILTENIDYYSLQNTAVNISPVEKYALLGKNVNNLYNLQVTETKELYNPYPAYNYSIDYELSLLKMYVDLARKAGEFKKEQLTQTGIFDQFKKNSENRDFDSARYVKELFDSVSRMGRIVGIKSELLPENYQWGQLYQQAKENYDVFGTDPYMNWDKYSERYVSYINKLFEISDSSIVDSWTIISKTYCEDSDSYISDIEQFKTVSVFYARGFDEHLDDSVYANLDKNPQQMLDYKLKTEYQRNPVYHYPDFAKQIEQYIQSLSVKYISALTEKQETLRTNLQLHVDWQENAKLVSIIENAVDYMEKQKVRLENFRKESEVSEDEIITKINDALYAKNVADSIYEEALDAYRREDLSKAEKLLLEASEQYSESLSILDDNVLRTEADNKKIDLSGKILAAKNEIVIRESRELYTQARDAQNHDRFDDAETLINAAITKWAETHTEKNPEFEDFRELVNTAVSMKTGRNLLPSDPLYPEMSQLLSIAYQYYDQGEMFMKAGNKLAAEEALEYALENLNRFKKVYPINQEASLLVLKIDRLRDPKKFEEEFAQKVRTALNQAKKRDTQMEGYNTLMDYYNLAPDYKGLKDTIYNLEIDLGMRQKPVDNSATNRSNKLTQDAQKLFNTAGNDEKKLNSALDKVNEALKVNPNNKTAEALKDRISTKIGGSSIIVLTSDDQNLLVQAKKAYQSGDVDTANTFMLRLLNRNPNNIKVKEVEELNNKIQSQL